MFFNNYKKILFSKKNKRNPEKIFSIFLKNFKSLNVVSKFKSNQNYKIIFLFFLNFIFLNFSLTFSNELKNIFFNNQSYNMSKYSWNVLISEHPNKLEQNHESQCTGSLIANYWVLTSVNCNLIGKSVYIGCTHFNESCIHYDIDMRFFEHYKPPNYFRNFFGELVYYYSKNNFNFVSKNIQFNDISLIRLYPWSNLTDPMKLLSKIKMDYQLSNLDFNTSSIKGVGLNKNILNISTNQSTLFLRNISEINQFNLNNTIKKFLSVSFQNKFDFFEGGNPIISFNSENEPILLGVGSGTKKMENNLYISIQYKIPWIYKLILTYPVRCFSDAICLYGGKYKDRRHTSQRMIKVSSTENNFSQINASQLLNNTTPVCNSTNIDTPCDEVWISFLPLIVGAGLSTIILAYFSSCSLKRFLWKQYCYTSKNNDHIEMNFPHIR